MAHRLLLTILFILTSVLTAQQYPDKKIHLLLKSGIDNVLNQEYDSARILFLKLKTSYPEIPLGDIYLAGLEMTSSFDTGIKPDDEFILLHLSESERKSEILLKENSKNIWHNYFAGLTKGYSAYYNALKKDWLSAFTDGIAALEYFEECISIDSSFAESYIALGTFKYWKSSKLQSISWLPFVEDERAAGMMNLKNALSNSDYNKYLAANSLLWAYIDIQDYEAAISLSVELLKIYPRNRMFKWILARAYQERNPEKSIEVYNDILKSYKNVSLINEITLKHKIAQLYSITGNKEAALKLCKDILSKNIDDDYAQSLLEDRLQRIKTLFYELNQ